jgi:hypothetical protein
MFPYELVAKIGSDLDYKNFLVLIASSKSTYLQREEISHLRNLLRINKLAESSSLLLHLLLALEQRDFELLKIYFKLTAKGDLKFPNLYTVKSIIEASPKELLYTLQNIILETPVDQLGGGSLDICFRAALASGNIKVVKMLQPRISGNIYKTYKDELGWLGRHADLNSFESFFHNCLTPDIEACLINAVTANNIDIVNRLMTINSTTDFFFGDLFVASIKNNNIKMFELLFEKADNDVFARNAIFECAIHHNNKLFIEHLLQNPLFTEKKCISRALFCAVEENNLELTKLFLAYPELTTDIINEVIRNTTNANIFRILLKDNRVDKLMIVDLILDHKIPSVIIDELASL